MSKWQPIETAPKTGEFILAYAYGYVVLCFYDNKNGGWVEFDPEMGIGEADMFYDVNHLWCKLPILPESYMKDIIAEKNHFMGVQNDA